mgnify:CR=1 FL=1
MASRGSKGYSAGAHVVFKLQVHMVFVTKYRRKVITERVFEVMGEAFREAHRNRAPQEMFRGPNVLEVHECFLSTDLEV